jgi:hypothetical protein
MSDDNKEEKTADTVTKQEYESAKAEAEKFKNEIRDIAKTRDELKSKLKAIEDSQKMDDGKTKELLDAKIKEYDELNAKFADVEAKANEYETYKKTKRDGLLAEIKDEESKSIAEDLSLDKLEIFVKKLKGTKAPDVDGGGAGNNKITLTDEQKAEAKTMGLSEQDYYDVQKDRTKNQKKD